MRGQQSQKLMKLPSPFLPPIKAIQMQSTQLPFSHSKRRGKMALRFGHHDNVTLLHWIMWVPLPEPMHTSLVAVDCARVISQGLCPSCHSGREWLDHTHYICVSVCWCQVAACVVDPISKAPGSQLHQGREECIADGSRVRGRMPCGAIVRQNCSQSQEKNSEDKSDSKERRLLEVSRIGFCLEHVGKADWPTVSMDREIDTMNCQSFWNQVLMSPSQRKGLERVKSQNPRLPGSERWVELNIMQKRGTMEKFWDGEDPLSWSGWFSLPDTIQGSKHPNLLFMATSWLTQHHFHCSCVFLHHRDSNIKNYISQTLLHPRKGGVGFKIHFWGETQFNLQ